MSHFTEKYFQKEGILLCLLQRGLQRRRRGRTAVSTQRSRLNLGQQPEYGPFVPMHEGPQLNKTTVSTYLTSSIGSWSCNV